MEPQPSEGDPQSGRSSGRSWITDGIIIGGMTVGAYFWTLFNEAGFFSYFDIPYGYISITPTSVLSISWVMFFFLFGTLLFVFIALHYIIKAITEYLPLEYRNLLNSSLARDFKILTCFLIWIAVGAIISGSAGKSEGETKEGFQVISESKHPKRPEVVVLRIYSDNRITARLNRSTSPKTIEREFYVLKMSEIGMAGIPTRTEKLDRLKLKE
jgi:hypothetical protein